MDYETDLYESDYWQGVLVITDKKTGKVGSVSLLDSRKRNITQKQFKSCIKSHGLERTFETWSKLVTNWQ